MNICVFGASSNDIDRAYIEAGEVLGRAMAEKSHGLIFGGGRTGLMGAVARGMDEKGGVSIGIAPAFFNKPGVLFEKCTEFYITETMRERKAMMDEKSDAFIVTPGGIGTMEEFFEIFTLRQLRRHSKPIGILNTAGYYDELIQMLMNTAEKGFMSSGLLELLHVSDDPKRLLGMIEEDWNKKRGK